MEDKTLRVLEFDKILNILAEHAVNDAAKERCLSVKPQTTLAKVRRELSVTDSSTVMLYKYGSPPVARVSEISQILKRVRMGGVLSMGELLNVAAVLKCAQRLKAYYDGHSDGVLDDFFECLAVDSQTAERISTAIISEEEMADGASPELFNIRRKINRAGVKIKDTLNNMIHSPHYRKFLQDPIVTLRNDRYVVPVKAECRADVHGIVHDTSASGGTVFIEPASVVEANNELITLAQKEKSEIEKILAELTAAVAEISDTIKYDYEGIIDIDVCFAKAKLAVMQKAVCPAVNDEGRILIKKGRHPLLSPDTVVPQNISLGYDFDSLIVTGPNTGGKTVALKTVGLFTVMAQSGLAIPADDGTVIAVFEGVFADIGDEQSIEQSLSTFSAHMKNIVHILDVMTPNSLVLFDELGAGTDPTEGAALANAILEYVKNMGAKTVATTHYSELKLYALSTERVENASCEFDVNTLSPTYRLLIGVPGKSNAFAISKRLGLSDYIIDRSKDLLSSETIKFEDVLTSIEENRRTAESARFEQEKLRNEVAQLKAELSREREKLDRDRNRIMDKANKKAAEVLEKAKNDAEEIFDELKAIKKEKDEKEALKAMEEVRRELSTKIKKSKKAPAVSHKAPSKTNVNLLKPGTSVLITDLNDKGTILSIDKKAGTAVIQMGIMKTTSSLSKLVALEDETKKNLMRFVPQRKVSSGIKAVKTEVDLRGMQLEEALMETDRFLDQATMAGLASVTIIHGKGTGILRKGIQDMLRRHPQVKSFRAGRYGEGENGVTIAELKGS